MIPSSSGFYKGVKRTLIVQGMIALCVGIYFHYNYENLTKEEGIAEQIATYQHYIAQPVQAAQVIESTTNGQESLQYQGLFGDISVAQKVEGTTLQNTTKSIQTIDIHQESIDVLPYIAYQLQNGLIDSSVSRYFIKKGLGAYNQFIQDLPIINNYINHPIVLSNDSSDLFHNIYDLIANKNYAGLVQIFQSIENQIPASSEISSLETNFTADEEFQYLFTKIHLDQDNMYKGYIKDVSSLFNINPTLIEAAIMTEQIRGFYTYRGYIKSIIKSNKFVMVMSQMSYGIGGIKEGTAMRIEEYFYNNYPDIYNLYFAYPEGYLPTQYTNARIARLTQTDDYYYQILYIGGLIKMILDNRSNAGIDIINNPGVILTLYNFGDKEPHANPEVGGAEITVNGNTYSFGGLGVLLYYILEIYG